MPWRSSTTAPRRSKCNSPTASGPVRDQLKQLGNVARLEIDRLQQTEGGSGKPQDAKSKKNDAQFIVSLYNPRSKRRTAQLDTALGILATRRPPGTPAAILTDVGRPGQRVVRTTLAELDPEQVDMLSLVVVGSSTTRWQGDRMVTPRGYPLRGTPPNPRANQPRQHPKKVR